MIIGLWTAYGALNSVPVFQAFKKGASKLGYKIVENNHGDINVIWSILWHGRMKKNKEIWDLSKKLSIPVIVLEVGYIKRNVTWRVGLNGINNAGYFGPTNNDNTRAKKLNLQLEPWKNNKNGNIIIASQHNLSGQWNNPREMDVWLTNSISNIRKYTDRKIIIRPHPRCQALRIKIEGTDISIQKPKKIVGSYDDYDFNIDNEYALVNYSSNPGIHAILKGIPAFISPNSLAYSVGNKDYSTINNPIMPDRTQWLNDLAYTEWTTDEISTGEPILRLTNSI